MILCCVKAPLLLHYQTIILALAAFVTIPMYALLVSIFCHKLFHVSARYRKGVRKKFRTLYQHDCNQSIWV